MSGFNKNAKIVLQSLNKVIPEAILVLFSVMVKTTLSLPPGLLMECTYLSKACKSTEVFFLVDIFCYGGDAKSCVFEKRYIR